MAESNVQLIREMLEAFNRDGGEAALDCAHAGPDLRWWAAPEWPDKSLYEGREGALELIEDWTRSFDEYRWDLEQAYDLGDRVLTLVHHGGRSGEAWIEAKVAAIWRIEAGAMVEAWFFFSWDAALAAAGVEHAVD